MTRARLDGLYFLLLGSLVFLLLGAALENAFPAGMLDFKVLYYPARCLLQHGDPYKENEVLRIYQTQGRDSSRDTEVSREIVTRYVYLPTAFSVTVPFAMLPWGPAHHLWMALTMGSLILASYLAWTLGANSAPIVSGALIGFVLANSEVLAILGNSAGIVVSLCVVAVWCFLRDRFVPVGIVCLAVSLAVKPHDAGLIWLYFLLAGGIYRRRALQVLLVTLILGTPAVLYISNVAPNWIQELHSNLAAFAVPGGLNDPGLASSGAHGLNMLLSLQTIISVFYDNPHIYNSISILVCAPFFLLWVVLTLRSRPSLSKTWLAIASITAISLLPFYHRQYDAKLLLLTVPACAMLWAEGGRIGRIALILNTAGLVLTGDLPWAILFSFINRLHLATSGLLSRLVVGVQVFPTPLVLLSIGILYLWAYAKRCSTEAPSQAA